MRATQPVPGYSGWLLACTLLTLTFFISVPPYQSSGDEILQNRDFKQGLAYWQVNATPDYFGLQDGSLTIEHPVARSTTLAQCWLRSELPDALLLSAEARTQGVVRGAETWHTARIDLMGYDARGEGQYQVATRLLSLEGDRPWRRADAMFELERGLARVCLEISLYQAPGRFQVRDLSLKPATDYPPFRLGRYVLLTGWVVFAAVLAVSLYRHFRDSRLGFWLLTILLLVLAGVLLPQALRGPVEQWTLHLLTAMGLSLPQHHHLSMASVWALWPEQWDLSKLAHLAGFTLLALLLVSDRRHSLVAKLSLLVLWAFASEVLQFFVPQRTPRLSDLSGVFIGTVVAAGWDWIRRSKAR